MLSNFTPAMCRGISNHYLYESDQLTNYIGALFHTSDMDGAYEDDVTWEGLGLPQEHLPLQRVNLDSVRPSWTVRYLARSWTLGIVVPLEDKRDDLYGIVHKFFPMAGGEFARSYWALEQILGAQFFGLYGFQTGTSVPFSPDGLSFFNTAHRMSKDNPTTWSNRPSVDMDLSIALAQLADAAMRIQKRPNGIQPIGNKVARVMHHPNERLVAKQIYQNTEQFDTANRAKNYLADEKVELISNPFWEYSGAVGATVSAFNSTVFQGDTHYCKWKRRMELETFSRFDNSIFADIITAMKRFAFGLTDVRGLYGSKGA